ncbi:putative phosphoglycerate mutase [Erysiphe neolycopersici]|uniref:Putative phosphoglycerate mutase n=1 Tax=Erysiphe neolycopersici TaxID=212602 RepID=A0A420I325_9PEZI|nr:putative phosphoglycerate mutase [Erysiphe neolycopersici]
MGSPPAVIIVVRHGARLDAADPQWHLTSPTPYDPPLTYGGWCQSKVLGARISSILQNRESDEDNQNAIPGALEKRGRGKRQYKIVIHTSPFLRCVQTSIGISAGLAQNLKTQTPPTKHGITSHKIRPMHSSPLIRPTIMESSALSSIPEPVVVLDKNKLSDHHLNIRCTLRVDSFLGEWLTPDYFDSITPPPGSMNMIVAAKADLLRREDYSNLKQTIDPKANQPFPGGWGNPDTSSIWGSESNKSNEKSSFLSMSSLDAALPSRERVTNRERTSSLIISGSYGNRHRGNAVQVEPPSAQGAHGFYQPPVPSYAISKSNPIPPGFVSHARDACVEVDYQWDSMREPQAWGKGGEYGEEWSSMHKRFRAGLQKLVAWYRKSDGLNKNVNRNRSNSLRIFSPEEEAANENTDLVVILVTHGAGCNALIGALTNQPVLLDVGIASLTMAVLKPTPISTIKESPFETYDPHLVSSSDKSHSLSDIYDVKIIANSEHLRSSTNSTPSSSRAPSVTGLSGSRDPKSNFGSTDLTNFNRTRPQKSSSGSVRRTASVTGSGGYVCRPFLQSQINSQGLWSAPTHCNEVEEDNLILDFGNTHSESNRSSSDNNKKLPTEKEISSFHVDKGILEEVHDSDEGKKGLWSSIKSVKKVEMIRDTGQKRRWTLDDRGNLPGFEKPLS